jgi:hypothetical protein
MGKGISRAALPLALAVVGSVLAPGIGTALGSAISGTAGTSLGGALGGLAEGVSAGALGAGIGSAAGTKIQGGTWGQSLLSGVGSYLGSELMGGATGAEGAGGDELFDVFPSAADYGAATAGQSSGLLGSSVGSIIPSSISSVLPNAITDAAATTTLGNILGSTIGSTIGEGVGTMIDPPMLNGAQVDLGGTQAQSNIGNAWLPDQGSPIVNSLTEEQAKASNNQIGYSQTQIGYSQTVPGGVNYLMPITNKDTGSVDFGSFSPTSYGNQQTRNRRNTWGSLAIF